MIEDNGKPSEAEVNSILKNTRNGLIAIAILFLLTNLDPSLSSKEPISFLKNFVPPLSLIIAAIAHFASNHPPTKK